MCIRDR